MKSAYKQASAINTTLAAYLKMNSEYHQKNMLLHLITRRTVRILFKKPLWIPKESENSKKIQFI